LRLPRSRWQVDQQNVEGRLVRVGSPSDVAQCALDEHAGEARARERLTVMVVLPTPPFPLATATTLATPGMGRLATARC
jgi:hypothetical protein